MTLRQRLLCITLLTLPCALPARAQWVLSGNENKIDLTGGSPKAVPNTPPPPPDSLSLLDFSTFPPKVTTLDNLPNSVVGPPSNIAISPDGKMALVANSLKLDASAAAGWVPEFQVHVIDLTRRPPVLVAEVKTDAQPSGLSFTPDGKAAIVANRGAGTVTLLTIDGLKVAAAQTLKVCEPAECPSDVAISPDGKRALVSIQKGGILQLLNIDNGRLTLGDRKISVYGQPYRVVFTPDGDLALTAGSGYGNGLDLDALSVIDMKADVKTAGPSGIRTLDHVPVGTTTESLEISPDGKLVAVVVMDGSNTAPDSPVHAGPGAIVLLQRQGKTFVKTQRLPVGRIPEGVAFTGDGKYLLVQCHPDRKIWIFQIKDGQAVDTGVRVDMPGMPSSIRAAMTPR